jgi:hypothetical protein
MTIILSLTMLGCPPPTIVNLHKEINNVTWRSDKNEYGIELVLHTIFKTFNYRYEATIEYNGEKYYAWVTWKNANFVLRRITHYGELIGGVYDDEYIQAGYDNTASREENAEYIVEKTVLTIEKDYIYDGALVGKEITLRPCKFEKEFRDVSERYHSIWLNSDKSFMLYMRYYMKNVSRGYITEDGKEKQIAVIWEENNRFVMYELEERIKQVSEGIEEKEFVQKEIIGKGTYKTEKDDLTMNFEDEQGEIVKVEKLKGRNFEDIPYEELSQMKFDKWYPPTPKND